MPLFLKSDFVYRFKDVDCNFVSRKTKRKKNLNTPIKKQKYIYLKLLVVLQSRFLTASKYVSCFFFHPHRHFLLFRFHIYKLIKLFVEVIQLCLCVGVITCTPSFQIYVLLRSASQFSTSSMVLLFLSLSQLMIIIRYVEIPGFI